MTLRSSVVEPVKRHLHDRLPKMCDADPEALSSYILALLQRDQPMDALRESCSTELEEFLGHQTSHFVNGLFSLIADLTGEGSSSHRKRHHEGSSRNRSSLYMPYENKRGRHDDRYRHHDHHRRSGDEYRVNDDYGRTLMDVPPPSSRHYDDRRMQMPRHPYNEYRSPMPSSTPYMQRMRPPSPIADQMTSTRRSSSRWPSNNAAAPPPNGQNQMESPLPQQPSPHHEKKPANERQQNERPTERMPNDRPRSPTNLMIANVPRELNNLASLSGHFSRFGEIVNIQIKANANRAFVQYRTHDQAKKALSCPEAVCNNRFIKVLWARYDPMDKNSKLAVDGDGAPSIMDEQILLLRQQEKDAQVRRDRLQLSSDINSKNTLLTKLKSMTGENAARQAQIEKLETEVRELEQKLESLPVVEEVAAPTESTDGAAAPSIQEQLAQAEKEAAAIGLVDEFGNIVYGKMGRGGSVRGRRGRGRVSHEGRRMSLDNRSKTLAVRGIPDQFLNEKMVRSHFQSFGELGRVVLGALGEASSALVEYKTRNMAQLALSQGRVMLKHHLELEWYEGQVDDVIQSHAPTHVEPSHVHDGISDDDEDEDVDRSWKR